MQTGTFSANACSAYGAPATITGTTSQTVASGNCYLLTLTGTDNVGNTATITTTVKVDTTAPSAPTGFAFSGLTNAYYPGAGTTIYFKGGAAGGFTATASGSTDADTGIATYNYGAIAGTGWANAAGAYTFTAASPTGTSSVTASNNAGLTSSATSFTAQVDSTAPGGGAFTANSVAASGGGSSSSITAGTTLLINSRTDYTDGGSGLASSTLAMQTGTLSGNACSGYGAPATIVGTASQTVASGNCYLLTLTGTDNVGNTATISTTIKVDTTAPSAPTTFGFSALTNSYLSRRRLDRLLQGRHGRRLHRHRLGSDRRRLGHRLLQLRRRRGSRLGQRVRRVHVHGPLADRHRLGHRHQRRRRDRRLGELHGAVRLDRSGRRRAHRQHRRGLGRRHEQLSEQRHDADDQQPHRLHRGADRDRLRSRLVDADDADRARSRATRAAPTAHPPPSSAPPLRRSRAATATC